MKKNFYITTPIYYPSARLHLGHAYTTIAGDVLKKYKEQDGFDVFYQTGTDEHGEKIEKKAAEENKQPKEFVDEIIVGVKELWELLNVDYDKFIRTTDENHVKQVQYIFEKLEKKGDIYLGEYEGKYCVSCESYYTETQVEKGKCPDCGSNVEVIKEESYFFKCSNYIDKLMELYDDNPEFILPKSRKNELVNSFIKPGLDDLAISRTNFSWGIPVPGNEEHVIYVWLDALTNYITALDYMDQGEAFKKYWPADVQLVGKEIIRFHAIYWPMILMALDLPTPKKIFAHGWLLMDSDKMSKSKGNIIYPEFIVERYGVDTLRYFLMREVPFGSDGQFTPKTFVDRINNDLANDLGNLLNRTIAMSNKYFSGEIVEKGLSYSAKDELNKITSRNIQEYHDHFEDLQYSKVLEDVWGIIRFTNKFIDLTEPWVLAKDVDQEDKLMDVLHTLLESLRKISILISPFLSETGKKMQHSLNLGYNTSFESLDIMSGKYELPEKVEVLFPRLDIEEEINILKNEMEKQMELAKSKVKLEDQITIEDFDKIHMVVGEITSSKKHPGADRLLVSQVNIGSRTIQVVSGIAHKYEPEEIVGKKVMVVENLKEVELRGELSQGMILCSGKNKSLMLIEPNEKSTLGDVIK